MISWRLKIAAKIVLSRLPIDYRRWKALGLFEHGSMEDPRYGEAVFRRHFARSGFAGKKEFTCLDLGPGDSLFSALLARAYGADKSWLVDVGNFAEREIPAYRIMADHLGAKGLPVPMAGAFHSLDRLLAECQARYLTEGLASLRTIPAESIDFSWSQAVLEHIRERDFDAVVQELRRISRPGAISSHRVDLQDHLGGALNNLRIGDDLWESDWFARSGFYTNRLRFSDLLDRFRRAGFAIETFEAERWTGLPTARRSLSPRFRDLPDDELLVRGFDVVLRAQ